MGSHPEHQVRMLAQHDLCATGTSGQLLSSEPGLRVTCLRSGPVACNRASADFMISSSLFAWRFERVQPDFAEYVNRGWPAITTTADQLA